MLGALLVVPNPSLAEALGHPAGLPKWCGGPAGQLGGDRRRWARPGSETAEAVREAAHSHSRTGR